MRRLAAVLSAALVGCAGSPAPRSELEEQAPLTDVVPRFVDLQHGPDEGYELIPAEAREDLAAAVVADPEQREALARRHGYVVRDGPDGAVLLLPEQLPDPRGWGLVAVRDDGLDLVVEVPHPRSDLDTDRLGAALAQAAQARWLVVAGARRSLRDDAADPSRRPDSLLHAVHEVLAVRGTPAVQVHGYADESLPDRDVVVSPGSTAAGPLVEAVADAADDLGLRTCRAWTQECGRLEGRRNVQGRASERLGAAFVHLEVARSVREDAGARDRLARAVAEAVADLGR